SGETLREEIVNHWTHLIGLLFSLLGFPFLIIHSSMNGDAWQIAGYTVYGATLILLYLASTYYHGCKALHHKQTWKIVDHACIYLLIAGSYTPFTLGPLRETTGWTLLIIEWSIAVVGILFKIFLINRFKMLSLITYLLMGWLVVVCWATLMAALSPTAIVLLCFGGLCYTLGAAFFMWESLPYNHGIWHMFVLGGSISHYFAILLLIA
ncbi:MAG TPA: hemolysin III family protein, partial [Parachlamydiaceae bacterium]|nr:hemolysin III family protein [Parachlamydiaceae bacterium]